MITLVFMTDTKRVIGGSSLLRNLLRMFFLPLGELSPAMAKIMKGDCMVIGRSSASFYAGKAKEYQKAYILSRSANFRAPNAQLTVCNDYQSLVTEYANSDKELLVLGGLETWKLFLPHAGKILIAETHRPVPGDLVFAEWDRGDFEVQREEPGKKLTIREYRRKAAPSA